MLMYLLHFGSNYSSRKLDRRNSWVQFKPQLGHLQYIKPHNVEQFNQKGAMNLSPPPLSISRGFLRSLLFKKKILFSLVRKEQNRIQTCPRDERIY